LLILDVRHCYALLGKGNNATALAMTGLLLISVAALLFSAPCCLAQWAVVGTKAAKMEEQTSRVSENFWLHITLRNTSTGILYIQGIHPKWYMVESYIKKPQGAVWEKQNVGIDQKLQMLPVKPGEEIEILRREALKHVGLPMILNFRMAYSEYDSSGLQILLDAFNIPNLETPE
jgi:hypothetical protein